MKSSAMGDLHIGQYDALFTEGILERAVVNTTPMDFRDIRVYFEGLEIHKPFVLESGAMDRRLLPAACREQSLTYGGACFLKIRLEHRGQVLFSGHKAAGLFPVMLRSSLCHLRDHPNIISLGEDPDEPGGYFIVSGYDKLVRFHIAYRRNHPFVVRAKPKDAAYTEYTCMIRSVGEDEIGQKNELKLCTDGNIHYKIYVHKRAYLLPLVLLLRALTETTDEIIYRHLGEDKRVLVMLSKVCPKTGVHDTTPYSRREALEYLGRRFRPVLHIDDPVECGKELIRRAVLIHLPKNEDKYMFLLDAVKKLLRCADGLVVPDNIDLPSNHELYTEAQLIALCVREKLEEIKRTLYRKILNIARARIATGDSTTSINASEAAEMAEGLDEAQAARVLKAFHALDFSIGHKVSHFLSTGNITTVSCSDLLQTTGFTILAERINCWRFTSHFQSVSRGAFFANLKITTIRKLRPEGWGFLCPIHTPDGSPCGLLLHLARGAHAVANRNGHAVTAACVSETLFEHGVVPAGIASAHGSPVYYNGKLMGTTTRPSSIASALRMLRAKNNMCVEVVHEFGPSIYEAIYISDGISSLMRRVYNPVTDTTDWIGIKEQVFLEVGLAKYKTVDDYSLCTNSRNDNIRICDSEIVADPEDILDSSTGSGTSNSSTIARASQPHAYIELDNTNMFSSVAACIPFADYNPSPRNIYQCQMAKQAMGVPAYNMRTRTDNKLYWVNYLQHPMVRTASYASLAKYPIGFNCIVAVLSYTAYDMEDAVVINKSAQERGLFRACIYKNEKFVLEKNSFVEYTPSKGQAIQTGDVLVRYTNEETSVCTKVYSGTEDGVVDCVRLFNNGTPCVTITLRIPRTPTIGDKFCSRHGQKGVLSMLWPEIDMPFTEQGLRPDIIINPHAFPSRMTIGMLLESMCGKAAMVTGEEQDATPFVKATFFNDGSNDAVECGGRSTDGYKGGCLNTAADGTIADGADSTNVNIGEQLRACGFNYYGNEPMYSGVTGTEFKTDIFIGSVYYQRLRHMVNDKYQVRTSGAVVATTRQPVGGRKNKGGIRFGEMERDALIAHGVAYTLRDRLMDCSDKTIFLHCSACSSILFTSARSCQCGGAHLKKIEMPYVFKYLCSELLAMNIRIKVDLTN